jgi:hypothetical protein
MGMGYLLPIPVPAVVILMGIGEIWHSLGSQEDRREYGGEVHSLQLNHGDETAARGKLNR